MKALLSPGCKAAADMGEVGIGDTHLVKPKRIGPALDVEFEVLPVCIVGHCHKPSIIGLNQIKNGHRMNQTLPNALYTAEQTRQLDQVAIEELGIPGAALMKRAGRAIVDTALARWPATRHWVVLCGGGNNGGDGYIVAALAALKKHSVVVFSLVDPTQLTGDAKSAYYFALQEGVEIMPFNGVEAQNRVQDTTVVIDALLGTGLQGGVREAYIAAIEWINQQPAPVVAADIASGLCADTGAFMGACVHAHLTVTFIGLKVGLFTGRGPGVSGQVVFHDLGVPVETYAKAVPVAERVDYANVDCRVPARAADAHKGDFGHVLVIGGDRGFGGAAILAAESASYSGAGLVGLATQSEHVTAALVRRPEVMSVGVPSGQELEPFLAKPTVLVVGPGLGQTPWSEQMLQQAVSAQKPLVLDADALNILAQGRIRLTQPASIPHIMTPHPGEAARLLGCTVEDIEIDRLQAVKRLQQSYGGVVVLKGAGTWITDGHRCLLANVGNPGLATGGSGDVLAGLIGALLAQGLSALDATQTAVCLHGAAADLAVEDLGVAGLLASDLLPYIRELQD